MSNKLTLSHMYHKAVIKVSLIIITICKDTLFGAKELLKIFKKKFFNWSGTNTVTFCLGLSLL